MRFFLLFLGSTRVFKAKNWEECASSVSCLKQYPKDSSPCVISGNCPCSCFSQSAPRWGWLCQAFFVFSSVARPKGKDLQRTWRSFKLLSQHPVAVSGIGFSVAWVVGDFRCVFSFGVRTVRDSAAGKLNSGRKRNDGRLLPSPLPHRFVSISVQLSRGCNSYFAKP